jgi:hypothetical protein
MAPTSPPPPPADDERLFVCPDRDGCGFVPSTR